jgi:gluconate 5-dehydrogenase
MSVWDRFRLDGKRALITGGSRGLGKAMARALAEAGADVILVGRDAASLRLAQEELQGLGRRVHLVPADISTPADAERMCERAVADHGPIDVLINNVGGRRISVPTEELAVEDWQRLMDLNLTSAFVCCKRIGGEMIRRRAGKIVNVASIAGMVVNRGIQGRVYETAKAALIAFTRTLAADWAGSNVNVNVIVPGGFWTDPNRRWFREKPQWQETFLNMVPMGRLGEPEEIAPLALYLASDASSYMTGAALVIDGGYTLW